MTNQPINDTDDIKEVDQSKWTKGACPPEWKADFWLDNESWVDLEPWED